MNKNYYEYIKNKIDKLDKSIDITSKHIQEKKTEIERLLHEKKEKKKILFEKNSLLDEALSFYRKNGYKTIIAKKHGQVQAWEELYLRKKFNEHFSILNKKDEEVGEIVGNKSRKIKLFLELFEEMKINVSEVNDETFSIIIRLGI